MRHFNFLLHVRLYNLSCSLAVTRQVLRDQALSAASCFSSVQMALYKLQNSSNKLLLLLAISYRASPK